ARVRPYTPRPKIGAIRPDPMPRWRNWQTHYLEVVALARAWRFESSPGHLVKTGGTPRRSCRFWHEPEQEHGRRPRRRTGAGHPPPPRSLYRAGFFLHNPDQCTPRPDLGHVLLFPRPRCWRWLRRPPGSPNRP